MSNFPHLCTRIAPYISVPANLQYCQVLQMPAADLLYRRRSNAASTALVVPSWQKLSLAAHDDTSRISLFFSGAARHNSADFGAEGHNGASGLIADLVHLLLFESRCDDESLRYTIWFTCRDLPDVSSFWVGTDWKGHRRSTFKWRVMYKRSTSGLEECVLTCVPVARRICTAHCLFTC